MRIFLFLLCFSFNAMAIDWFDMESGKTYKVTQSFELYQEERSGSLLDITKGDPFVLKEIIGLGMGLGLFNFHYVNCPGPAMTTDISIIPVNGTSPLVEIGAMVAEKCELWVYVELKDFWTKSLFE